MYILIFLQATNWGTHYVQTSQAFSNIILILRNASQTPQRSPNIIFSKTNERSNIETSTTPHFQMFQLFNNSETNVSLFPFCGSFPYSVSIQKAFLCNGSPQLNDLSGPALVLLTKQWQVRRSSVNPCRRADIGSFVYSSR